MKFSSNIDNIQPSGTFEFFGRMKELIAKGEDIIPLVAGELDFETPKKIAEAGIEAIQNGKTRYTLNNGILELRESICKKLKNDNNINYSPDQILVSSGSKQAIFNSIFAQCGKGDEVIIFSPYYPSYPEIVKLAGATPVLIETTIENNFEIDSNRFENAITNKTKLVILNSPNNPSGKVYSKKSLLVLLQIIMNRNLFILSDEMYEKIIFDNQKHYSPAELLPELHERTIVINGFSKTYAMTGWRVGYVAGPKELIEKAAIVQSHTTSNASSISQFAALEALRTGDEFVKSIVPQLTTRRDKAIEILSHIDDLKFYTPGGAFYLFINVKPFLQKAGFNSFELAMKLLQNHRVAVVPGTAFGSEDYIRISYATDSKTLEEGCRRLRKGLSQL